MRGNYIKKEINGPKPTKLSNKTKPCLVYTTIGLKKQPFSELNLNIY